jgi:hypothetical protein
MIRVTVRGMKDFKEIERILLRVYQTRGGVNLEEAAELSRKAMISIIEDNRGPRPRRVQEDDPFRKTSHKHLKDTLTVEAGDGFAIIGDLNKVEALTPYWAAINWGGVLPPPVRGTFSDGPPVAGGGTGKFLHRKRMPWMTPGKKIVGIHYIYKTLQYIEAHIYPFLLQNIKDMWYNLSWKNIARQGNKLKVRE